ncbi:HORMA domain [Teratosphaeria destructans]|uniref:HORMA domain n=1 Tax=Teratosphaeria destructans TaxID=418781 RepID=A0A9W7VYI7_9PEZI|nr:HORMA domain [Teratosphaeria destructans]
MATKQIQKSTTKTAIDQKQSLEVVQTMLHGGLSSLSYLRGFFDEAVFDEQVYGMSDSIHSYDDYAAAKLAKEIPSTRKLSTKMQVLRRGRSRRVEILLDWLEMGVFPALRAGHLQALEVYVHPDRKDRQKVLETYTFTIKYQTDEDARLLAGLQLDGPGSALVSVQATNLALQTLLRDIGAICDQLPTLPASRFISMEMFYMPSIERVPHALGWQAGTGEKMLFAAAPGWDKHTKDLKSLGSVFHNSTLAITSLAPAGTQALAEPPQYPQKLWYQEYSKYNAVDALRSLVQVADPPQAHDDISETVTPSTIVNHSTKPNVSGTPLLATQLFDSMNTQSSNVHGMKQAFGRMMHPETNTQGDTQLQSIMQPPPAPHTDTKSSPGRTTVSPSRSLDPNNLASGEKAVLLTTKAKQLERAKSRLIKKAKQSAKDGGWSRKKGQKDEPVNCQCGHHKEEDDMVCCTYCDTWQHLPCYGYIGRDDPRIPNDHVCYQCLLGDEEQPLLESLKELSTRRRGMDFALLHGLKSMKQFAKDMDLESWEAMPVYQHLKNMKYIVEASGSHKPGYSQTGKPLYVAARSGEEHEDMMQKLFDPTLHIEHHYHLPSISMRQSSLSRRLLDKGAENSLPPPATPVSQLRKRNAMTPASGLEPRESMTPYQTPSRPSSLRQKRTLDTGEINCVTPAAKKRMTTPVFFRPKSLRTCGVLDANGLPSSPAFGMPELR